MMAKLYELSRPQGEGPRRQQTEKVEACAGQKGFLFNSLARRTDYSEEGRQTAAHPGQREEGGEEENGGGGGVAGALTTLPNTRVQYLTADRGV